MTPLHGLILTGGHSRRMGTDKAGLDYHGVPQVAHAHALLRRHLEHVFVSVRPDQVGDPLRSAYPLIVDRQSDIGPAAGLLAAHEACPDAAWLVIAVDMPFLDGTLLEALIAARAPDHEATVMAQGHELEPLCAIWEAEALRRLGGRAAFMKFGLRDMLAELRVSTFRPRQAERVCFNVNFSDDYASALNFLKKKSGIY